MSNEHALICLGCGAETPEDVACVHCVAEEVAEDAEQARLGAAPSSGHETPTLRCGGCGGHIEPGAVRCRFCKATVSTKRCGGCLGWNLASAKHCGWCGSGLEGREPGPETLPCPRCRTERMRSVRYADLSAEECGACGGLFLSPAILDRLVSQRDHSTRMHLALPRRPYSRETKVEYLSCPVCAKSLNRKQFSPTAGVVIDTCKDHGVWFDGGELQTVLDFVTRGGLEQAREKRLAELAEAERSLHNKRAEVAAGTQRGALMSTGNRNVTSWLIKTWIG